LMSLIFAMSGFIFSSMSRVPPAPPRVPCFESTTSKLVMAFMLGNVRLEERLRK
jgi:hypothetical protein